MERVRLPRSTGHAFGDLGIAMGFLGVLVGAVFPVVVVALGVADADDAFRPLFQWICLGAGLLVAVANFALARALLGARVRRLNGSMVATGRIVRASGAGRGATLTGNALPVDSRDEFGTMARTYNELLESLERSWEVQRCLQALTSAAGEVWSLEADRASVCHRLLEVLVQEHRGVAWARASAEDGTTLAEVHDVASVGELVREVRHRSLTVAVHGNVTEIVDLLDAVADTLALALSRLDLQATVQRQASVDDLTGVLNRRAGLARIRTLGAEDTEEGSGLLLVDLDHFKDVNDRFGHLAGDEVLRSVGALCRKVFRPEDVVCRYGGEEILVFLTGLDEIAVTAAAERLRAAVAAATFPELPGDVELRVTASIGVRWWRGAVGGEELRSLVAEADAALYAAKAGGRDRVVVHPYAGETLLQS